MVAVTVLHANAFQVGTVSAAISAPVVALALLAGRVTRRLPSLLVACNVVRVSALGILIAVNAITGLRLAYLVVVAVIVGSATVFYDIGCQTIIPQVVSTTMVVRAVAALQAVLSVTQLTGPAIAGFLLGETGPSIAVACIAAVFAFGAMNFSLLRSANHDVPKESDTRITVTDGLRFVFRTPVVRSICTLTGLLNLQQQAYLTVFTIYLVRTLGVSTGVAGMVLGAGALGALIGSLTIGELADRLRPGAAISAGVTVAGAALFLAGLVGISIGKQAPIALAAGFVVNGFAQACCNVFMVGLRQVVPPPEFRPAVNATSRLASYGPIPIGALIGGSLAGVAGSAHALLLVSGAMVLTSLYLFRSPLGRIRTMADPAAVG